MNRMLSSLLALALLAGAGCSTQTPDTGPLEIDAIGPLAAAADPDRRPLGAGDALLLDATAEGLVGFDAAGQIEPALAERWIVTDDGLGYIFRLRDARWADGKPVTAVEVVRRLRAALRMKSANTLRTALAGIEEVSAVTPQIVDVRLRYPVSDLLALLARPELAIRRASGEGTGAYRVGSRAGGAAVLVPRDAERQSHVVVRGGRAAAAVARFAAGRSDLVVGGTLGTLPFLRAAHLPAAVTRVDPVEGLYGLIVSGDGTAISDPVLRRALAMLADSDALVAAARLRGVTPASGLVPPDVSGFTPPPLPDWMALPGDERRRLGAATVSAWATEHGAAPRVTVARPEALGDRLMVALVARAWRAAGVEVDLVDGTAFPDLRLIDGAAPVDDAGWFLDHFTCGATPACSPVADAALAAAARAGPVREALLRESARLMAEAVPFFPLAAPLRWSLVDRRLDGYRDNAAALHPIARLRTAPAH